MRKSKTLLFLVPGFALGLILFGCKNTPNTESTSGGCFSHFGNNTEWSAPVEVTINGYSQNAMEPKPSFDQVVLFWNDKPATDNQMNIHYAIKDGSGVYQYKGTLTGTVDASFLDGVPSVDLNGQFYFVSTRSYSTDFHTIFGGLAQVIAGPALQINSVAAADAVVSAGVNGTLDMDADVTWDGLQMVVSRATFSGHPYPETSRLKYFDVSSRLLSARSDTDTVFQNVNFSDCRTYAGSISRDKLEIFFTVLPGGGSASADDFRIAVAKRTSVSEAFSNPQLIQGLSGQFTEGPSPTYDDLSKTLFFHRWDGSAGKFKIYKVSRP